MDLATMLQRLQAEFHRLQAKVRQHDDALPQWQLSALEFETRFHEGHFNQRGAKLGACLFPLEQDLKKLTQYIRNNYHQSALNLIARIESEFTSIERALQSTEVNAKQQQLSNHAKRRAIAKHYQNREESNQQYRWIAKNIMRSSHAIAQEIDKHLGWQKQLQQKIREMEFRLGTLEGQEKLALQTNILKQMQRLGKCEQAIDHLKKKLHQKAR